MLKAIHIRPLLVFSLAFAAGIAFASCGLNLAAAIMLIITGSAGFVLAYSSRALIAIIGLTACGIGCGALRYEAAAITPATDISRFATERMVTIDGIVDSDPQRLPGRSTFIIRATRITTGDGTAEVTGQVFATELLRNGAHAAPIDYGDKIQTRGILEMPRPPGNPGAFSWRDYLSHRGIHCQLVIRHEQSLEIVERDSSFSLLGAAVGIRNRIVHAVQSNLHEPEASVLLGILIGRRTDLPVDLNSDFIHTGTVHILASAGLHVGILSLCLLWLARKLTLPRKLALILLIGVLAMYALICGGRPSVTRAVIMASVFFAGIILERESDTPTSLGAAGFAILLWQPMALLEEGFQLSFLTVATLAVCMPVWDAMVESFLPFSQHPARRAAVWAVDIVGVSIFAHIGSAPIVAAAYNEFAISGILANLLVVPLLFLLIPFAVTAGLTWPAAGIAMLTPCATLASWIIHLVRWCGESEWSYRAVPSPSLFAIAVYYAAVFAGAAYASRRLKASR